MTAKILFDYLDALHKSGNFDMEVIIDNDKTTSYFASGHLFMRMNLSGYYNIYGPKGETLTESEILNLSLKLKK